MRLLRSLVVVAALMMAASVSTHTLLAQEPQAPPEQQSEFVPLSERPAQEELPSARLVIGAYAFVVLVLFGYLLSLSKKLGTVAREIDRLEADVKRGHRA